MNETLAQIAARIRDAREIANLSEESVAAQLGILLETYQCYEAGHADIPVSVLYNLAMIFHVEMSALLTGEEPKLHLYSIVRKGKGVSVDRRKAYKHESLGFNFVHKKAEPFLVTVEPEATDKPLQLNAHPGQEFNYVLHGAMRLTIANHDVELQAGDSIFFDSGYEHGMRAMNGAPVQFLAVIL